MSKSSSTPAASVAAAATGAGTGNGTSSLNRQFNALPHIFDDDEGEDAKYKVAATEQYLGLSKPTPTTVNANNSNGKAAMATPSSPLNTARFAFKRPINPMTSAQREANFFSNSNAQNNGNSLNNNPEQTKLSWMACNGFAKFTPAAIKQKYGNAEKVTLTKKNGGLKNFTFSNADDFDEKNKELAKFAHIEKIEMRLIGTTFPNPVATFPTIPATAKEGFPYKALTTSATAPYGAITMVLDEGENIHDRQSTLGQMAYRRAIAGVSQGDLKSMYSPADEKSVHVVVDPPAPFLVKYNEHPDVLAGNLQKIIPAAEVRPGMDLANVIVLKGNESAENGGWKYIKGALHAIKWAADQYDAIHNDNVAFGNVTDLNAFAVDLRTQVTGEYNPETDTFQSDALVPFDALHRAGIPLTANPKINQASDEAAMKTPYETSFHLKIWYTLMAPTMVASQ
jgi:hypothetical protein